MGMMLGKRAKDKKGQKPSGPKEAPKKEQPKAKKEAPKSEPPKPLGEI